MRPLSRPPECTLEKPPGGRDAATLGVKVTFPGRPARIGGPVHPKWVMTRSDKEARSRLQGVGEEGGDAAALQAVLELRRLDPHHVPGHLAGDHPDAEFACETDHV